MKAFFAAIFFFLLVSVCAASTSLTIQWRPNNDLGVISGFKVERALTGPTTYVTWQTVATVGPEVKRYTDSGLAHNTMYQYRIRAYNTVGVGPASNILKKVTRRS